MKRTNYNNLEIILLGYSLPDAENTRDYLVKRGISAKYSINETCAEFKNTLENKTPDIVISEFKLPDGTGLDALTYIITEGFQCQFIFFTNPTSEQTAVNCMKAGSYDYILKENISDLHDAIDELKNQNFQHQPIAASSAKIARNRLLFRTLANMSPVGIFRTNLTGETTYVNRKWCELAGISSKQAMGNGWFDALHPDDIQIVKQNWQNTVKSTSTSTLEYRFLHKDGQHVYVIGNVVPELERGEIKGYIGTTTDITELKKMESELKNSEERIRNLIDNVPVGITLIDQDGIIQNANKSALNLFGYDNLEEIAGNNISIFYSGDSKLDFPKNRINVRPHGIEIQIKDFRGNEKWILETTVPQTLPDGKHGYVSIVEDITQRNETNRKIIEYQVNLEEMIQKRTSELEATNKELLKLHKAVEFSPSSVIVTNSEGIIEYVNPRFTEVSGYTKEEAIGQTHDLIRSGEAPKSYYENLWSTIRKGNIWHGQFKNKKKNGEFFWELVSIAPIVDKNEEITHFVSVKQDITDKIIAEEKLRSYLQELEIFNKSMVDRELRIIEMKKEVNKMCLELGIPEKYITDWDV